VPPVALVTGASKGIGAACAVALAREGYDVGLTYAHDRAGVDEAAAEVARAGARAHVRQAEARDWDDAAAVVEEVEQALGPLDALVANAGITRDGPAVRMTGDAWRAPIDVNLTGTMAVVRAALRGMMRRRAGSIVTISSVVGVQGNAGQANYAASKAGLVGLARSLAREFASRNITVNVVSPGPVDTEMLGALGDERRDTIAAAVPLGRVARPDEIAAAVRFLASDEAAFITGTVLPVDGGLGMGPW